MTSDLTLGAEEELHLIDLRSRKLVARAPQILARLPQASYSAEIQRSTVETNTDVVDSLAGLRAELLRLRRGIVEVAAHDQIGIAAAGTAPSSAFADFELTTTGRYGRMQEQYRLLVDEQLICGLQIHVGVPDRDLAVEIMQRIARDLPVLLALSASSPFWNEQDSGYASMRSMVWQRWPTAGATGRLGSAAEYDEMIADLIRTGVIADARWPTSTSVRRPMRRPSSCAPAMRARWSTTPILIAGLFRATVLAARHSIEAGEPFTRAPAGPPGRDVARRPQRAGRRAARRRPSPRTVPAADAVDRLVNRLRPQLSELGDWDEVSELAASTLARGNSADRQRAAYAERGRLHDVVDLVVRETHGRAGGPESAMPALRRYRYRAGDEAVGPSQRPRPVYATWSASSASCRTPTTGGAQGRPRPMGGRSRAGLRGRGRVRPILRRPDAAGDQPARVAALCGGLIQRARAIECSSATSTAPAGPDDGVLAGSVVVRSPGWREEATAAAAGRRPGPGHGLRPGPQRVRRLAGARGQRAQPQRPAFAIAIRDLVDEVLPDLPRPDGPAGPGHGPADPADRLLAHAAPTAPARCSRAARQLGLVRAPPPGRAGRGCCSSGRRPRRRRQRGSHRARATDRRALPAAGRRARRPPATRDADRRRDLRRGRGRRGGPGQRPGQRGRRRQVDVLLRARADRLLPRRAAGAGVGAHLPASDEAERSDRAGPGRRAGHQAGRRARRRRRADRAGRHRRGGRRTAASRDRRRTRPAGWRRRWSRCRPTPPWTGPAGAAPRRPARVRVPRGTGPEACPLADWP